MRDECLIDVDAGAGTGADNELSELRCRLCLENNPDIFLCCCSDGFHMKCFEEWVRVKGRPIKRCDVCLAEYSSLKYSTKTIYNWKWFVYMFQLFIVYVMLVASGCTMSATVVFLVIFKATYLPILYFFLVTLTIASLSFILFMHLTRKALPDMSTSSYKISYNS